MERQYSIPVYIWWLVIHFWPYNIIPRPPLSLRNAHIKSFSMIISFRCIRWMERQYSIPAYVWWINIHFGQCNIKLRTTVDHWNASVKSFSSHDYSGWWLCQNFGTERLYCKPLVHRCLYWSDWTILHFKYTKLTIYKVIYKDNVVVKMSDVDLWCKKSNNVTCSYSKFQMIWSLQNK